jgi:putative autotransporter adhesin-like protein
MKKVGIIIFIVALVAGVVLANLSSFGRFSTKFFDVSMNFGSVSGSGTIIKETRNIADFKSLDVGGVFRVEVTAQKDFKVEVESDDNLLPFIKTDVREGTLHIETDKRLRSNSPIVVRISAPDIENLETSGASNISIENIKNARLGLDSSGASKVSVQGETSVLVVDVSGASRIDAGSLSAGTAKVDASGATNVAVNVADELNANATGASRIIYSGAVKNLVKKTSGAGSVSPK